MQGKSLKINRVESILSKNIYAKASKQIPLTDLDLEFWIQVTPGHMTAPYCSMIDWCYIQYMYSSLHSATQNLPRKRFISLSIKQLMLTPNLPSEFFQHVTFLCYDVIAFLVIQLMFLQ